MPAFDPDLPATTRRLHLSWAGTIVDGVTARGRRGSLPPFAQWLGLDAGARRALLAALPPAQRTALPHAALEALETPERPGEAVELPPLLTPLWSLLDEHRVADDPLWTLAARAIACGCFGSHHLWQDLGVSGRSDVTRVLNAGFGALAAGNERDLKWKRYLFLTLGQRLGEVDLRPPKCERCDEFAKCFADGPPPAPGPVAGRYP